MTRSRCGGIAPAHNPPLPPFQTRTNLKPSLDNKPAAPTGSSPLSTDMAVFNRLTLIKLIELLLAITIYWLHYETFEETNHVNLVIVSTAFLGYLIVVAGTFLGLITGSPVNKTVDMYFCLAGAVLYIVSGSFSIQHFKGWTFRSAVSNKGLAKGSLAIVQGALFLVDGFFTFKAE